MPSLFIPGITEYLDDLVPARPPELAEMERDAREHDFPIIGPACGQCCYLLTRLTGARRVFELEGGMLSVADGWQPGPRVTQDRRWDPELVGPAVRELIAKAPPPQKVHGT